MYYKFNAQCTLASFVKFENKTLRYFFKSKSEKQYSLYSQEGKLNAQ